jgi:hypothetical protein
MFRRIAGHEGLGTGKTTTPRGREKKCLFLKGEMSGKYCGKEKSFEKKLTERELLETLAVVLSQ